MADAVLAHAGEVEICEVGPRDGLQNHSRHFEVAERIQLVNKLFSAGLKRVEAVSFVNDRKVPRMAGAEAVVAGTIRGEGRLISGLVLNQRGAERALATPLDELRLVVVASESFSRRNQGASVEETLRACADIAREARASGRRFSVIIATAFGCPFEGVVPVARVAEIAARVAQYSPHEIVLADTIGAATPFDVSKVLDAVMPVARVKWGCHFHNTRNMGFANTLAAIAAGVMIFDASIGGLGGCPFAPRATGNIATEELVFMLGGARNRSLPDLDALLSVVGYIEERCGSTVPGLLSKAGRFPPTVPTSHEAR
jgi:hydroxymethylglutaryl-CoA lyase